jgi:NAD(P)-dependent dehydrogenase (short-subunit alcohol dehydrogenase family)
MLDDRTVVITGAGGGIGRALARRVAGAGARLALTDVREDALAATAEAIGNRCLARPCDLRDPQALPRFLEETAAELGPVDVFVANAGVAVGTTPIETRDADWELALDVNLRHHVAAARVLLPGWLERGRGHFVSVASAAGLLTQIGSAPYAVTKHAAVAFAEWLAVTYGDRGVAVTCVCPMGVATDMLEPGRPGALEERAAQAVTSVGTVLDPDAVAAAILEGMETGAFLVLPHPEVLEFFRRKATDYDRWLAGMRRLQARLAAEPPT